MIVLGFLAFVSGFLSLETTKKCSTKSQPTIKKPTFAINDEKVDDFSDDENFQLSSINSSINISNRSRNVDEDDNNNESNVTPTLNSSIPRVTPEAKIANSTPLNHYANGFTLRKFKRDLSR